MIVALVLTGASALMAQDSDNVVTTFFPNAKEYLGAFASYGGTDVKEQGDTVTLSNDKMVGAVRWFVTHQPLPKSIAASWDKDSVLLEIRCTSGVNQATIFTSWRGQLDPSEFGTENHTDVVFAGNEWTTVKIPVPDVSGISADNLTGLVLKIDPAGKYEIRRIAIVQ